MVSQTIVEDLKKAQTLNVLQNQLNLESEHAKSLLGSYYLEFNTNINAIKNAYEVAKIGRAHV